VDQTITSNDIANGTITSNQIANATITSNHLADAAVYTNNLAFPIVTAIGDGTITTSKIDQVFFEGYHHSYAFRAFRGAGSLHPNTGVYTDFGDNWYKLTCDQEDFDENSVYTTNGYKPGVKGIYMMGATAEVTVDNPGGIGPKSRFMVGIERGLEERGSIYIMGSRSVNADVAIRYNLRATVVGTVVCNNTNQVFTAAFWARTPEGASADSATLVDSASQTYFWGYLLKRGDF
jgi:hypothetical protein